LVYDERKKTKRVRGETCPEVDKGKTEHLGTGREASRVEKKEQLKGGKKQMYWTSRTKHAADGNSILREGEVRGELVPKNMVRDEGVRAVAS